MDVVGFVTTTASPPAGSAEPALAVLAEIAMMPED
jgi:hypothetical protein